jgi:hypothetical protein
MPLRLVPFPRQRTPLEQLMQIAEGGELPADLEASVAIEMRMAKLLRPFAALISDGDKTLLMPPVETR